MGRIGHELRRHFSRRQLKVHHAGGQRALRHTVKLARGRGLHHHHAALALDGAHAQCAVAAGTREHDANGALMLVQRQRAKQKINRQAVATRCCGLQQLQRAVQKCHVAVGWDDVGAVGLHHHTIHHLKHLHAGATLDQLGEQAFVVGVEVLHQDKGHAGINIGWHAREKRLNSGQATGRSAHTDNGEAKCAEFG
ncbi:MAG: hypothetical protein ACD_23C01370G0002 [uncultured bacterium]|nr:MAG: hypothetical protein ACD_23C01370G0002 [uncultured bacterium]